MPILGGCPGLPCVLSSTVVRWSSYDPRRVYIKKFLFYKLLLVLFFP